MANKKRISADKTKKRVKKADKRTAKKAVPAVKAAGQNRGVAIKKTPVLLVILFQLITLGIYYPIWFLRRMNSFNKMAKITGEEQISKAELVSALVLEILSAIAVILGSHGGILTLITFILLTIQAFRSRRIMISYQKKRKIKLVMSGLAVFFISPYYLQFKINRMNLKSGTRRVKNTHTG
ncbi:MAG: DUF4234 domain-containing protein [Candidatus Goldbacteria bacterium]|nr:DUF4234 domain-containing protein [Candidatus Goldiibacteriota bacterium]